MDKEQERFSPKTHVFESCPHCGRRLSPWEQVLLSVDRALMCKGCWYRIILNVFDADQTKKGNDQHESKEEKR